MDMEITEEDVLTCGLSQEQVDELRLLDATNRQILLVACAYRRSCVKTKARAQYKISKDVLERFDSLLAESYPFFRRRVGLRYEHYCEHVVKPVAATICEYRASRHKWFTRSPQLPIRSRCLRMLLYLRGESMVSMAWMFEQDTTTFRRDIFKLLAVASEAIVPQWIQMPRKSTPLYATLRDSRAFRGLADVVYAGDATHFDIHRLSKLQFMYWNTKYSTHAWLYLTLVDGNCVTRLVIGPYPGSVNDMSIFHDNPDVLLELDATRFQSQDKVLWDSILGTTMKFGHFLPPSGAYKRVAASRFKREMDKVLRHARYIVEHSYARIKNKWRLLGRRNRKSLMLRMAILLAVPLTNVELILVPVTRKEKCGNRYCKFCQLSDSLRD